MSQPLHKTYLYKKKSVIYPKSRFNWESRILSGNPIYLHGICSLKNIQYKNKNDQTKNN